MSDQKKVYVFRHPRGGFVNEYGGEPCGICADTMASFHDEFVEEAVELGREDLWMLERESCELALMGPEDETES